MEHFSSRMCMHLASFSDNGLSGRPLLRWLVLPLQDPMVVLDELCSTEAGGRLDADGPVSTAESTDFDKIAAVKK